MADINQMLNKSMEKVPDTVKKAEVDKQQKASAKNILGLTERQMTPIYVGSAFGFLAGIGFAAYRYNKGTGGLWGFLGWSIVGNMAGAALGRGIAYMIPEAKK